MRGGMGRRLQRDGGWMGRRARPRFPTFWIWFFGGGWLAHRLVDHAASLAGLVEDVGDELLAAEARVDRHEEDDVDLVHDILEVIKGGGRVEHEAGLAASGTDKGEGTIHVVCGLRMEGDVASA